MDETNSKKTFIIPKKHASFKGIIRAEKTDSRNVIELFDDIKSCALEMQFDFRQDACSSCDAIRNPKLQKLYNEKRASMKKEHDIVERLAFHVVPNRQVASLIANDGIKCDQLSMPIKTYLGNPKEGVHLSKRPDVLLLSSTMDGPKYFGLLVCKILLGRGYSTVASTHNLELSAQPHYDHHRSKNVSFSKDDTHLDDLLAGSLVYCYEHKDFKALLCPTQILPIAIVWYSLNGTSFSDLFFLTSKTSNSSKGIQESNYRAKRHSNGTTNTEKMNGHDRCTSSESIKSNLEIVTAATPEESWNIGRTETDSTRNGASRIVNEQNHTLITPQPSSSLAPVAHEEISDKSVLLKYNPLSSNRDPRLSRNKLLSTLKSSENVLFSPTSTLPEKSISEISTSRLVTSATDESSILLKTSPPLPSTMIPLLSNVNLVDPRSKIIDGSRMVAFLDFQILKSVIQQQRRLTNYYESKTTMNRKTFYRPIPYLVRRISDDQYQRLSNQNQLNDLFTGEAQKQDYPLVNVSVVDFFEFGFSSDSGASSNYIELNCNENKLAYDQMERCNNLTRRENRLNSQQIRLSIRENRQKKMRDQMRDIRSNLTKTSIQTKKYVVAGRQFLKEYPLKNSENNTTVSKEFLEFLSREYRHESRSTVKHVLAELVGIFVEKYRIDTSIGENSSTTTAENEKSVENEKGSSNYNCVDMEIQSPVPTQSSNDYDERFSIIPVIPAISSLMALKSVIAPCLLQDDSICDVKPIISENSTASSINLTRMIEHTTIPDNLLFQTCPSVLKCVSIQSSSSTASLPEMNSSTTSEQDRSREEFLRILSREASISKSSDSLKQNEKPDMKTQSDTEDRSSLEKISDRIFSVTRNERSSLSEENSSRKISNSRTVTLIDPRSRSSSSNVETKSKYTSDRIDDGLEQRRKRMRTDSSLSKSENPSLDEESRTSRTVRKNSTDARITYDCRRDLDEKRRRSTKMRLEISDDRHSRETDRRRSERSNHDSKRTEEIQRVRSSNSDENHFLSRSDISPSRTDISSLSISSHRSLSNNSGRHKRIDYHHRSVNEQTSSKLSSSREHRNSYIYSESLISKHRTSIKTISLRPSETFERLGSIIGKSSKDSDRFSKSRSSPSYYSDKSDWSSSTIYEMSRQIDRSTRFAIDRTGKS